MPHFMKVGTSTLREMTSDAMLTNKLTNYSSQIINKQTRRIAVPPGRVNNNNNK